MKSLIKVLFLSLIMGHVLLDTAFAQDPERNRLAKSEELTQILLNQQQKLAPLLHREWEMSAATAVAADNGRRVDLLINHLQQPLKESYHAIIGYAKLHPVADYYLIYHMLISARLEMVDILMDFLESEGVALNSQYLANRLELFEGVAFWGHSNGSSSGDDYGSSNNGGSDYYYDCCHPGHNSHCSHCGEHHDSGMPCYYSGGNAGGNQSQDHHHGNCGNDYGYGYDYGYDCNCPVWVDSPCGVGNGHHCF